MSAEEIYEYNRYNITDNYIGPITRLFCVKISNSPDMTYFLNEVASVSQEDINTLD